MNPVTSIGYASDELHAQAVELAQSLEFNLDKDAASCLFLTAERLTLKMSGFTPLYADFTAATWSKRRTEGKKQGLVRACKPVTGLKIIDATAGWGRDGAVLASFGAEVLLLERHPVMASLLVDALNHQTESDQQKLKLSVQKADAYSFLSTLPIENYPDVIYIDPMHPERQKSALVKKDMQALQQMIGADEDALKLIEMAISRVKQRVVVKWPQKVKSLLKPDLCIEGKTVRFDIYLPSKNRSLDTALA